MGCWGSSMTRKKYAYITGRENNRKFNGMIIREIESIMLEKQRYDFDFPDHAKMLSSQEIWHIAKSKVMEDLCLPDSFLEDNAIVDRA